MKEKRRNRPNAKSSNPREKRSRRGMSAKEGGPVWLWGTHAVAAALANPARYRQRLIATENAARRMGLTDADILGGAEIDRLLPPGAVHQGVAFQAEPLSPASLDELIAAAPARIAVLDQLADPHNLGAIFRSAAAFGVGGIILQTRHSPPITGVAAKSAAGAIETVSECRVVNISRTLETLADAGYLTVGLAGDSDGDLSDIIKGETRLVITMGAEGAGLRQGVAKACQRLARIPMAPGMESLNVSNAAAIAFYEASRGTFSPE